MTTKTPLEAAPRTRFSGSYSGPGAPNQVTGSPTSRAKEAPVTNSLVLYSTKSPAAQEKGKEVERFWYSLIGCWSKGTGHSVSAGLLLPFLKEEDETGAIRLKGLRVSKGRSCDGDRKLKTGQKTGSGGGRRRLAMDWLCGYCGVRDSLREQYSSSTIDFCFIQVYWKSVFSPFFSS